MQHFFLEQCSAQCDWKLSSIQSAVIFPSTPIVTFVGDPSFIALPRQIPLASFCRPETLEYPSAAICDFAWSAVIARSVECRAAVADSAGSEAEYPVVSVELGELGVTVVEQGCSGAAAE